MKITSKKTFEANGKVGESITILPTALELTTEFVESQIAAAVKKNSGANDYAKTLGVVSTILIHSFENGRTFQLNDFLTVASHLDLPFPALRDYFNGWTDALEKKGRLKSQIGAYSDKIFQFV